MGTQRDRKKLIMPSGVYTRTKPIWNKGKKLGGMSREEAAIQRRAQYKNLSVEKRQRKSEQSANWWRTHQQAALLHRAKMRAKNAGIAFNLHISDIIIPEYCPIFPQIKLSPVTTRGGSDSSPSLDRIKPDIGYIKGNVQVISSRANRAKSNLTPQEIFQLAQYLLGQNI